MSLLYRLSGQLRHAAMVTAALGVLLSPFGAAAAEPAAGLQAARPSAGVSLGAKAAEMLKALDTREGDVRAVSIVEVSALGETTLYQYLRFRNPAGKPLDVLSGIGSFAAIPYLSVGGRQAEIEWGEYLPNGIERKFTARLEQPVPPGEWIEMIMVGERMAKYKAQRLENGRWRLGPVTAEVAGSSVGAVFAIKLPPGARHFHFRPKPDEVCRDRTPTAIWRKALAEGKDLKLYAEYERQPIAK